MWIIEDIWREIKSFLFHNIKIQGKHLKNDTFIKKFNQVVKSMPSKYMPTCGPRIIYQSTLKPYRCARFLYRVQAPCTLSKRRYSLKYKLVIEHMLIGNLSKDNIREEYSNGINSLIFNNAWKPDSILQSTLLL
jgi:hypothetical protein